MEANYAPSRDLVANPAFKWLTFPATIAKPVPCERLFSISGHVMNSKHASLSPDSINITASTWQHQHHNINITTSTSQHQHHNINITASTSQHQHHNINITASTWQHQHDNITKSTWQHQQTRLPQQLAKCELMKHKKILILNYCWEQFSVTKIDSWIKMNYIGKLFEK